MQQSIPYHSNKINTTSSRSSVVSKHSSNLHDALTALTNNVIRKNLSSFLRAFTKHEIEVFKYLMYYWRKWENIQIPIQNLCDRFNLKARRIHYILNKLNELGILATIKKGYTGKATRRTVPERGLMLWNALSKGFSVAKQVIPRTSADSYADSPRPHTNYISTKVELLQGTTFAQEIKEPEKPSPELVKSVIAMLRGANRIEQ